MNRPILFAHAFLWGLLPACGAGLSSKAAPPTDPAIAQANQRNPFLDADFFLNPDYVNAVEAAAQAAPAEAEAIRKVKRYPTAMWLSSIADVANVPRWLGQAKKQQQASGKPALSLFVVYDLPNRDCASKASAGELKVSENGVARYRSEFIDRALRQAVTRESARLENGLTLLATVYPARRAASIPPAEALRYE